MTRAKILAMTPGLELDELVAEKVFRQPTCRCAIPARSEAGICSWCGRQQACASWSSVMLLAWQVFQNRCERIFNKRTAFFRELGELLQLQPVSYPDGVKIERVAWPDAMMYLDPEKICKAALLSEISE